MGSQEGFGSSQGGQETQEDLKTARGIPLGYFTWPPWPLPRPSWDPIKLWQFLGCFGYREPRREG